MFGDKDVIEASRAFVCVRPDSFENETNQAMVRKLLGGSLQNTAFCILAPDGVTRLSRAGRGFTPDVGGARGLRRIASRYERATKPQDALTPDFDYFEMALNIASADSRLILLTHAAAAQMPEIEKRLRGVAWNDKVVGRFHFDQESNASRFAGPLGIEGTPEMGFYVVEPDEFGLKGKVRAQLSLDASNDKIIEALMAANAEYAAFTKRKEYKSHVAAAMTKGIYFQMPMAYGEDWDGDGKIDSSSSRRYSRARSRAKEVVEIKPN